MVVPIREDINQNGSVVNFKPKGKEIKLRKDGLPKQTKSNGRKGVAQEVYPIKDKEDIEKMKQYFRDKIDSVWYPHQKKIAGRDLLLFKVGLNLGLRCGDLVSLKWGEILDSDGNFKDGIRRQEQKTKKFKTFFLNQACRDAFTDYINEFKPCLDSGNYIFRSREGGHIEVRTMGKVIKEAGVECGIKKPLGSHSLRKSFGYFFYMAHLNDVRALTHLQRLFAHSSPAVTLSYIGIEDEESKEYYDDVNL